jgi:hypothetical protein
MLNSSTADKWTNAVERCERRARTMRFGGLEVINIFAYRATNPKVMKAQDDRWDQGPYWRPTWWSVPKERTVDIRDGTTRYSACFESTRSSHTV